MVATVCTMREAAAPYFTFDARAVVTLPSLRLLLYLSPAAHAQNAGFFRYLFTITLVSLAHDASAAPVSPHIL